MKKLALLLFVLLAGCSLPSDEQYNAQLVIDQCLKDRLQFAPGTGARALFDGSCSLLQKEYRDKYGKGYRE